MAYSTPEKRAPAAAPGNSLTQPKETFSSFLMGEAVRSKIMSNYGEKDGQRFISSILSAVSVNPALAECEKGSIVAAAMLGESLKLSPSPQLGYYYMVPYKKKDREGNVVSITAQFQLGYKGYIQLALRSGYYKKINVLAIKEGELRRFDVLNEEIDVNIIEDDEIREATPTAGYYAMFEYTNGFRKAMYWSRKKMMSHADKYSQAFSADAYKKLLDGKIPEKDMWRYSSFWYKDFDGMAFKTMLRQLIGKWGVLSIEMQKAFDSDTSDDAKSIASETPDFGSGTGEVVDMGQADDTAQDAEVDQDEARKAVDDFFGDSE